jgi:hypothetical protein
MPMVAEAVPGCLHISLFLFSIGLADSLFNINTTVGISTIVPIGICCLLYILTIFLPIISPQSPYQNSFSGIIWFLFRKLHVWNYRDQGHGGELKAGTGTDATCDGGDGGTQGPRCRGDLMAD